MINSAKSEPTSLPMKDPLSHVWAKSTSNGRDGESLTAHTANVLARLAAWRDRYPDLSTHTSRSDLWDLASWACTLHDLGKVAPGFQAMLRGGPAYPHRHEALSLVAVGWLDVDEATMGLVAAGVATHHRDRSVIFEMYPAASDAVAALLDQLDGEEAAVREWLGRRLIDPSRWGFASLPAIRSEPPRSAFDRAMMALELLAADLEGSSATVPDSLAARMVRGLVLLADHAGSAHQRLTHARSVESVAAFRSQLGPEWVPYDHQAAAATAGGNVLLVAPTGSGKTEAAFLWAAHQREQATGAPVLFYVLPYRASLNAMHARILERYAVPRDAVVLQHASATAALYKYLLEQKTYTVESATRVARNAENLGRLMTAPRLGDSGRSIEDFQGDEISGLVVVEDDARLVLVALGDGDTFSQDHAQPVGSGTAKHFHPCSCRWRSMRLVPYTGTISSPRMPMVIAVRHSARRNPMRRRAGSGGIISWRIASNTTLNRASYFCSSLSSFRARSLCVRASSRKRTKARTIWMLAATATRLLSTEASMSAPCSVNA